MAEPLGSLSFFSLLRRGLAAGLQTQDTFPSGSPTTTLDTVSSFGTDLTATTHLTLVGPGDIVGVDSRVVVRTFPKVDEGDAEFEHFALIEFDQADFPWRYSPAAENAAGQLRPWLNLVVLEEGDAPIQPPNGDQKLPVLTADLAKLPDLAESWAWAHVQIEGKDFTEQNPDPILERLEGDPGLFVARLVSPRVLEPQESYVACLVPTFDRGRLIGTGEIPSDSIDALAPAWGPGSSNPDPNKPKLPVYYSWRFQTGTVGSFKELAKKIRPHPIPPELHKGHSNCEKRNGPEACEAAGRALRARRVPAMLLGPRSRAA